LNHGAFFKQYHVREAKLPVNSQPKSRKVAKPWLGRTANGWRRQQGVPSAAPVDPVAGAAGYTLYSVPDSAHPNLDQPPPPVGLGLAASDLEELSSLVNNRTAVTITD
jgi:hypothetical protein